MKEGDNVSMSKKIKMLMLEREVTQVQLAEKMETTQSNLANKLKRDNFSEKELNQIAELLNATFEGNFILNDTHRSI